MLVFNVFLHVLL